MARVAARVEAEQQLTSLLQYARSLRGLAERDIASGRWARCEAHLREELARYVAAEESLVAAASALRTPLGQERAA